MADTQSKPVFTLFIVSSTQIPGIVLLLLLAWAKQSPWFSPIHSSVSYSGDDGTDRGWDRGRNGSRQWSICWHLVIYDSNYTLALLHGHTAHFQSQWDEILRRSEKLLKKKKKNLFQATPGHQNQMFVVTRNNPSLTLSFSLYHTHTHPPPFSSCWVFILPGNSLYNNLTPTFIRALQRPMLSLYVTVASQLKLTVALHKTPWFHWPSRVVPPTNSNYNNLFIFFKEQRDHSSYMEPCVHDWMGRSM